ncbi:MAG TPA: T9SS type A sorting domain-containing protein, partial [Bacteroidia bacterium]|nr:T9SS type A sorting domain-containing protein [Bacteroidia bacterium]
STVVTINQPAPIVISTKTKGIRCHGASTLVVVSASGGTAPYTGTGSFTVTAGTYTYTVTDATGCTNTSSVTLTEPTPLTSSSSATPILCNGGLSNITMVAAGGTPPYSYPQPPVVSAGTYTYTIWDNNGCGTTTTLNIAQPSTLSVTATSTPILCNGGSATVSINASGGTPPYSGNGTFHASAGTYKYVVTDANGCSASVSITISQPQPVSVTTTAQDVLCNGGTSVVNVTAQGGTAPFTGTGAFTVNSGTYTYTVNDANGCAASATATVNEPTPLIASASAQPIICHGGWTGVAVTGIGGTAPYLGLTTAFVQAGTYSYSIADANGCSASATVTISEPPALVVVGTETPANCGNTCMGTASVQVSGGTAPYTYSWQNNGSANNSINLCTGDSAVVSVFDNAGCKVDYPFAPMTCLRGMQHSTTDASQKETQPESINMTLFPNPAADAFSIAFSSPEASEGVLTIYDLQGRQILNQHIPVASGLNSLGLHASELSSSEKMVFIRISFGTQVLTQKLLINRNGL